MVYTILLDTTVLHDVSRILPLVVKAMYWYPPYPPAPYFMPYDPMYLMASAFQWMIYPYYWMFYIEAYKIALDAWKKAFEAFAKSLEQTTQKQ